MAVNGTIHIAVVMTCYNRREKTLSCLRHLIAAEKYYGERHEQGISLSFYITDDGCTDGTGEAVRNLLSGRDVHVVQGDGNLYWAGGMRAAWREALKDGDKWDFYLLQNDDTDVFPDCLGQLMLTHDYSLEHFGKPGIYSGITCSSTNREEITYGGYKYMRDLKGDSQLVKPSGTPQSVDLTNANILLVAKLVVDKVGIFYSGFRHGGADYDYTGMVRKKRFPALVTPLVCGECDYDHPDITGQARLILSMDKRHRMEYFSNPTHSLDDYLLNTLRNMPLRYPQRWIGYMLNLHFPRLYYKLHGISL